MMGTPDVMCQRVNATFLDIAHCPTPYTQTTNCRWVLFPFPDAQKVKKLALCVEPLAQPLMYSQPRRLTEQEYLYILVTTSIKSISEMLQFYIGNYANE
jgi:hypothetical protein